MAGKRGRSTADSPDRGSGATVTELPDGPADSTGLTPRQQRVLTVIRESHARRIAPAGQRLPDDGEHPLRTLEEKGYIRRDPNRPRALSVAGPEEVVDETGSGDAKPTPAYVPVVGRIAAGGPILAEERVEEVFPLPKALV